MAGRSCWAKSSEEMASDGTSSSRAPDPRRSPARAAAGAENPYRALLDGVIGRQAGLVAQWTLVGFIHGVMNTDNTAISGETIDYGPCAFMDAYDPGAVFSSIDQGGRYAYANQPRIAHWNLSRLAETLLPLLGESDDGGMASAEAALAAFGPRFEAAYLGGLRRKIGLATEREGDTALVQDLLARMADNAADFTLTFRSLCAAAARPGGDGTMRSLFADGAAYDGWAVRWRARLAMEPTPLLERVAAMRRVNPAIIPRPQDRGDAHRRPGGQLRSVRGPAGRDGKTLRGSAGL